MQKNVTIYVNGKEVGNNVKAINAEFRKLKNEISTVTKGSEEYNRKIKELQGLKARLQEHQNQINGISSAWGGVKSQIVGLATGVIGGNILLSVFQKVSQFIPQLIQRHADMSDSLSDVMKTTGMTREEVDDLNKSIGAIDTRTGRKELLKLASDAGKLGIEGHKNIMEFVEASDQINVALGEDLGQDAIINIGKLNDLFKVKDVYGYKEGMLKTGSAINELGANSSASESYLVEFARRLGGIGSQAGFTVQQILGLGATLDSLGQTTEVSSTAIGTLITDMFKDVAMYANIADMEVAEFSKLLNTDANEALIQVLSHLNSGSEGFTVMVAKLKEAGIESSRATQVLSALSNNIEMLRKQQDIANKSFAEGSSLTKEFDTKNNNLAANLIKVKTAMAAIWNASWIKNGIEFFLTKITDYMSVPVSDKLRDEQAELNNLVYALMNVGTNQQLKNKLIDEMNSKYPQYFKNLNLEIASNEQLRDVLDKINEQYTQRIIIQTKQEEFDKKAKKSADQFLVYNKELEKITSGKSWQKFQKDFGFEFDLGSIEGINEAIRQYNEQIDITMAKQKQDIRYYSLGRDMQTERDRLFTLRAQLEAYEDLQKEATDVLGKVEDLKNRFKDPMTEAMDISDWTKEEMENWLKEWDGFSNQFKQQQGIKFYNTADLIRAKLKELAEKDVADQNINNKTVVSDKKKHYDDLKKLIQEYQDFRANTMADGEDKELNQEEIRYQREVERINKLEFADKDKDEADRIRGEYLVELAEDHESRKMDIYTKYREKREKEEEEAAQARRQLLESQFQAEMKLLQIRLEFSEEGSQQRLDIEMEMLEKQIDHALQLEEASYSDKLDAYLNYLSQLKSIGDKFLSDEQRKQIDAWNKQLAAELQNTKLTEEEKSKIISDYVEKLKTIHVDAAHEEAQLISEAFKEAWDLAVEAANGIGEILRSMFELMAMQDEERMHRLEESYEHEMDLLKDKYDKKLISEQMYNQKQALLEWNLEKERKKIAREQAERDKALRIFNAVVGTAAAVVNALSTGVPPANFINAGITAALGAIQIGLISAEPLPAYAEGGFTKGERKYIAGEKGREWIGNNDQVNDSVTGPIIKGLEFHRVHKKLPNWMTELFEPDFDTLFSQIGLNRSADGYEMSEKSTRPEMQIPSKKQKNPGYVSNDNETTDPIFLQKFDRLLNVLEKLESREITLSNELLKRNDEEIKILDSLSKF